MTSDNTSFSHYLREASCAAKNPGRWAQKIPRGVGPAEPESASLPLVSIITIVRNGGKTLERAIKSVLGQSYKNIEYVVVDGGSTDNTLEIIHRYRDRIAVSISEPDSGIGHAFNKGICRSRGEIIGILNADDWYEPSAVENAAESLRKHGSDVVHGQMYLHDTWNKAFILDGNHGFLSWFNSVNHPTVFARRSCFQRFGLFREDLKISTDYEWFFRTFRQGARFSYLEKPLTHMSSGGLCSINWMVGISESFLVRSLYGTSIWKNIFMLELQFFQRYLRMLMEMIGVQSYLAQFRRLFFFLLSR